jgi:predicted N-acetyltransferase YhbS
MPRESSVFDKSLKSTATASPRQGRFRKPGAHACAPMPGMVTEVAVSPGQEVKAGDKLVVLEAMKMLTTVSAATRDKQILGFACFDTTQRGFFGPTAVAEEARGLGLGKALLMKALEALREIGYAYAIIGGVGPREFYEKACGAIEIPGSDPGTYGDLLP